MEAQDHGNRLKDLANDKNIRDARKLYQYARALGMNFVTQKMAVEALKDSVQRQVLAPAPSGKGHFASSRPGQDIQADLIDFSKNTFQKNEHRYAVVGADVFTRKVAIEPVKTKTAATVRGAMRNILRELDADEEDEERRPALIRTDKGNEFASLNGDPSSKGCEGYQWLGCGGQGHQNDQKRPGCRGGESQRNQVG